MDHDETPTASCCGKGAGAHRLSPAATTTRRAVVLGGLGATALAAGPLGWSTRAAAASVVDPIPTPAGPVGTRRKKSLLIGLDGAMLDRILAADTPRMKGLIARGLSAKSYRYSPSSGAGLDRGAQTSSGPGWSTLLTGTWPEKHGVYDNSFTGKRFGAHPDYLSRAQGIDPRLSTFAIADWDPIATPSAGGPIIGDQVDVRIGLKSDTDGNGYTVNDARTADVAARHLRANGPDLSFVYLGKTDAAGHSSGAAGQAFLRSLEADDAEIGMLIDAIEGRPSYASEDWQIIVTNDHGHLPGGGHGGSTLDEREQFVIAAGGGIPRSGRRDDLAVTDIVPTIFDHVGLSLPSDLDGTPIRLVVGDAFDSVRSSLRTRRDESGIPTGVVGWTHTPPSGWSVDNSAMPNGGGSGGVTEWRGWAFTTSAFWCSADRGQGREGFTRGRGVIAVADSDEFADASGGASFDSTLRTPAYDVTGAARVVVSFETWYQQEDPQRGRVLVSFDGAAPVLARTYTSNTRGRQRIAVPVPTGARSARAHFRYTGANNWYWALDQVSVTPQR